MLNPASLEQQIKNALSQYLPDAFEEAAKQLMPGESDKGKEICKAFGQTVGDLLALLCKEYWITRYNFDYRFSCSSTSNNNACYYSSSSRCYTKHIKSSLTFFPDY